MPRKKDDDRGTMDKRDWYKLLDKVEGVHTEERTIRCYSCHAVVTIQMTYVKGRYGRRWEGNCPDCQAVNYAGSEAIESTGNRDTGGRKNKGGNR